MTTQEEIKKILSYVFHPKYQKSIIELGYLEDVHLYPESNTLRCLFSCPPQDASFLYTIEKKIEQLLKEKMGFENVQILITSHQQIQEPKPQSKTQPTQPMQKITLPHMKHIIAIASGKGGVGKSTTAVNLAVAFAKKGFKIGLLDADIYGPSIPRMTNTIGRPEIEKSTKKLIPHNKFGVSIMSIGYMTDEATPMIWRGPMVQTAIRQMIEDVKWPELDILFIDLPPGTGDAQLTMAQKVPLTGAIVVSTPQDIALLDARRGIEMFRKTNVPILGLIENMSYFECPNCHHQSHIFSHHGVESIATSLDIPYLGGLPLDIRIREQSDEGKPFILDDHIGAHFQGIIDKLIEELGRRHKKVA